MASEVAESFQASLDELKFNSKPQISMLTMLAEDNEQYASEIVQVIEEQIKKVSVARKLPILYLVDSVVKNLPKTIYPHLFEKCIVQIFCGVFEEVDEKTRQSMYKLRQTWVDIIQNKRLYALDVGVHHIDPAWPVTASPPEQGVIHVNPRFLKSTGTKESSSHLQTVKKPSDDINDELHAKERELQKVQLELEQSKKRLEKQQLEMLNVKSGRRVVDREPPPLIALPPAVTSSISSSVMSVKSRGPQVTRDPRLNRDPRLRKQLEAQEKEVNSVTTPMTSVKSSAVADDTSVEEPSKNQTASQVQASVTPRLDLESLLNSFTNAATKVAAVQAHKNIPLASENESSHKGASLHKASHNSETHKSSQSSNQNTPQECDIKSSDARDNKRNSTYSSHKGRQSSPQKKLKMSPPLDERLANKLSSGDQKPSSNSVRKESKLDPKAPQKSLSSEKIPRDPREGKNNPKESNKDAKSPDNKNEEKGSKITGTLKGSRYKGSDKDSRGTSLSPRKDKNVKGSDRSRPNEKSKGRNDANNDKRSPRSQFRSSPDKRGDPRERNWDKKHTEDPVIQPSDCETDQFGRKLRKSDSKDAHRDRSPLKKDRESSKSPRGRDQKSEKKEDDSSKNSSELSSPKTETDAKPNTLEVKDELTTQSQVKNESPPQEPATQDLVPKEELQESEAEIQDVDMRIAPPVQDIAPSKINADQAVVNEQPENITSEADASAQKRPKSESDSSYLEGAPSEKRPKLDKESSLKQETKPAAEDISQLFGGEDVDYRNLNKGPSRMIPPPIPSETLLSPTTIKSPAERRWSQFKENHPDDFAHETERKRLRSVQMQEMQDVDMRQHLVSPVQRSLPLPPVLEPLEDAPRPKERSVENRDLILQRADKELKEGRMSPGNHRELVRQVEEVYDMPRGRPDMQRPVKNLDLRDPRLRGSHEQGAESEDGHDLGRPRPKDGKPPPPLPVPSGDLRNGPHPMDRKIPPHLPKSSRHDEMKIGNHSPVYQERDEDLRRGYRREFEPHNSNRELRGRYRNVSQDYDERSPRDFDYDEDRSPRDFDDRRPNQFRDFDRRPRRKYDADDKGPYYEENDRHHYERGRFHEPPYVPRHPGRHDVDDIHHGPRRNSPPLDRGRPVDFENRRGRDVPPNVDMRGHRGSFEGPDGPPKRHDEHPQGRIPSPDHPPFVNKPEGPPRPLPGPAPNAPPRGPPPHPPRHRASPSDKQTISDPLEDPRWAPMRGLLDSDGTEEVVLDDKPFELRMGTSRKLRMYGEVFEVAVDMKERGIRVDGQLVYKLGEPIKEVPIRGRMIRLYYHGHPKQIWLDGQQHEMRIDAPPRNVMVDGSQRGFQIDGRDLMILVDRLEKGPYGGPPRKIRILGIEHDIGFQFPSRQILIDGKPCELKLDSKIPFVIIEGKPHGIRFDGEPRTIFINDQPYVIPLDRAERVRIGPRPTYIAFGGPAHELIIDGKWFEVKFDNMPKDIHLGNRHFSIRIPGPLPRVKILDQMPSNFDVSGLMMTHKIPQPGPPRGPVPPNTQDQPVKAPNQTVLGNKDISPENANANPIQPKDEPSVPPVPPIPPQPAQPDINRIAPGMKPDGGNPVQGQNNVPQPPHLPGPFQPNRMPGFGKMNQQPPRGMMGPANRGMMPQGPGLMPPQGLGMLHQGMIPPGLLNIGMMPPGAGMMQQPGANFMQNLLRPPLGGNPMLQQIGQNRPPPNMMAMQTNAGLLSQPQPMSLIAQGLLSHMANNMQFAAALGQMSNQNKPESKVVPSTPIVTTAEDHSAAMATGLQGTSSSAQNKNPAVTAPNVPSFPSSLTHHLRGFPANLPGNSLTSTLPHVTTPSTTTVNSTSLPTTLLPPVGAISTAALVSQVTKPSIPAISSSPSDSKSNTTSVSTSVSTTTKPSEDAASKAPIDINSLLSSLLKAGLIKDTSKSEEKPMEKKETNTVKDAPKEPNFMIEKEAIVSVPDMTDFSLDELKNYHKSVVDALHEGIQCHTCSARFTEDDQEKYRAHLDWHFRQNKIEQEMVKVAKNRKWFYTITDWIQYEELEDAEEKSRSEIFEQMKAGIERGVVVDQLRMRGLEGKDFIKNPVASGIEGEDVCATCGDPFDQMWNEETEEWILKNTIKVDGKTYHPVCYEDLHETPSSSVIDDNRNPFDAAAADALLSRKEEEMETDENPVSQENKAILAEKETKNVTPVENQTEGTEGHVDSIPATVSIEDKIKTEIKQEKVEPVSTSSVTESSIVSVKQEPGVSPIVRHAPNLLSTIASTIKREVIPINQEDPSSPWEMDSNPTPELSRTPTPEPIPSFTPVPSQSSDSVSSSIMTDIPGIEDPIPSSCATEACETLKDNSTCPDSISVSVPPDSSLDTQKLEKGS